jgi:hypothetical protein
MASATLQSTPISLLRKHYDGASLNALREATWRRAIGGRSFSGRRIVLRQAL